MITTTLIAMLIIFAVLGGWVGVQALYRRFSARHPEMGLGTGEATGGCGLFCFCKNRLTCPNQKGRPEEAPTKSETL